MVGWVILAVLVAVALAAPRYGTDSRGEWASPRHRVGDDLALLRHAAGRLARTSTR